MNDRPVTSASMSVHAQRLDDDAVGCVHESGDEFTVVVGGGLSDVRLWVWISLGQLQNLKASVDALLEDRSRSLEPPDAIEEFIDGETGYEDDFESASDDPGKRGMNTELP